MGQHILKVFYNPWYIKSSITKQWGKLINGAETNDYPYGKNEIDLYFTLYTITNSRPFRGLSVKDKTLG